MPFFMPRQAQTWLLHAVIWVLLGVLLFTQPAGRLSGRPYYLLQAALFVTSLSIFYLNSNWAVPRLLYHRRVLLYIGFVVIVVLGVVMAHRRLQTYFEASIGNFRQEVPQSYGLGPRERGPGGPQRSQSGILGWVNPAVVLSTLLVVGLGTSVAAVQRGQRESQLRQALEQEKLSTELSWLKAQINPHFFFNTLNNIYSLTLLDGERAREAIHRLSRMMRYVLYDTQHGTAQLSQEVQFLQDYIDLMQLRLTDNVQIEFTTPHPLQEAPIAPMILLTFVENAFKHGVSTLAPSRIRITVQQPTPQTLEVTVQNSVFADRPVALDENSGIGLVNTRRRLELLYPNRHTLTVTEQTPEHEYQVHLLLRLS
ncbi:histidine kinase [Hymenobacter sp. BT188]|nr:histidine kinase [Hymenobacter sp. BT188]